MTAGERIFPLNVNVKSPFGCKSLITGGAGNFMDFIVMPFQESAGAETLVTQFTSVFFIFIKCLLLVSLEVLKLCEFLFAEGALDFLAIRRLGDIVFSSSS